MLFMTSARIGCHRQMFAVTRRRRFIAKSAALGVVAGVPVIASAQQRLVLNDASRLSTTRQGCEGWDRRGSSVKVEHLSRLLRTLPANGMQLEHVYDS
jgi:hypothetical protein